MRYRKKPIEIEAFQPLQSLGKPWPAWAQGDDLLIRSDYFRVWTTEGEMVGTPTCWLIKGVEGELYPCKDSVFQATYEEAASDE